MRATQVYLVLFLAGIVLSAIDPNNPCGQSPNINYSANLTIETQADADAFQNCIEIDHNLVIKKSFPGDFKSNLQKTGRGIYVGDLTDRPRVDSSTLTSLSFPALTFVSDVIFISGANGITDLDFPELEVVDSELALADLPNLKTFNGLNKLYHSGYISIVNTGIERLDWNSSTKAPETVSFYLANNTNLDIINIPDLEDVSGGSFTIYGSGNTKLYSRLQYVSHLEVTGIDGWLSGSTGFNYLSYSANRAASTPFLKIYDNTFETLTFDNLEYTNGSIDIHSNPNLSELSFPSLYRVNSEFDITDNPNLKVMDHTSFQNLRTVGYMNLTGAFEEVAIDMVDIRPLSFFVRSTGNISCVPFDRAWEYYWIVNSYGCAANGEFMEYQTNNTRGESSGESGGSDGGGGGIGKKGLLIVKIVVPIAGSILWAGIVWCLCARHRRHKREKVAKLGVVSPVNGGAFGHDASAQGPIYQPPMRHNGKPQPVTVVTNREVQQNLAAPNYPNGPTSGYGNSSSISPSVSPISTSNNQAWTSPAAVSRAEELDARERAIAERERQLLDAREAELAEKERKIAELELRNSRLGPN